MRTFSKIEKDIVFMGISDNDRIRSNFPKSTKLFLSINKLKILEVPKQAGLFFYANTSY